MNTALLVFLIITILLLFVSMVLDAMAASNITSKNYAVAHKYATISAIISGLSVAALFVILGIYIYTSRREIGHAIAGSPLTAPAPS